MIHAYTQVPVSNYDVRYSKCSEKLRMLLTGTRQNQSGKKPLAN